MSTTLFNYNNSFATNGILDSIFTQSNTSDNQNAVTFNLIQQQLLNNTSLNNALNQASNTINNSFSTFTNSFPSFPGFPAFPIVPLGNVTNTSLHNSDGTLQNAAKLVVPFSGTVKVGDVSKISLTGIALSPATYGAVNVNIPIASAIQDPNNHNQLIITTQELVPANAILTFNAGSITDGGGHVQSKEVALVPTGLNITDFSLANRPWTASNPDIFGPQLYNGAADYQPFGSPASTSAVLTELTSNLAAKVALGDITLQQMNSTLSRFNDPTVQSIIPDASLRGALLSLVGTSTANTIDAVLGTDNPSGRPYKSVEYVPSIGGSNDFGISVIFSDGTYGIEVNPFIQGEPIEEISGLLAHEALEENFNVNLPQEMVASIAEFVTYGEQLLYSPQVAQTQSAFTQDRNIGLMALLNSGSATHVGFGVAPQPGGGTSTVFPNSNGSAVDSFESLIRFNYPGFADLPNIGNPLLVQDIAAWTGKTLTGADFSDNTVNFINSNFTAINNNEALAIAHALQLKASQA